MKALSFLGTTNYKVTTYTYRGRQVTTEFFAEALTAFFPELEKVIVFATPAVQQHPNLKELKNRLRSKLKVAPIPSGHSEEDLWNIFDALTSAVNDNESVIFDITNSFRSLPFLVFLAAAYLKSARNVAVEGVVYGAFDATRGSISPVFDLTPFVSLLDWMTATDQFIHTGDARRLAHLLNPEQKQSGPLADAAHAIENVSLAAFLCQPFELFPEALALETNLQRAESSIDFLPRPYQILKNQIVETFGAFGATLDVDNPKEALCAEFRMIEWYYNNNQLIQAVTLAREWLIDAVTYRMGAPLDFTRFQRKRYERAISGLPLVGRQTKDPKTGRLVTYTRENLNTVGKEIYDHWPERDQIIRLWNNLSIIRNGLDHAGHQKDAIRLKNITKKIDSQIMPALQQLAELWALHPCEESYQRKNNVHHTKESSTSS